MDEYAESCYRIFHYFLVNQSRNNSSLATVDRDLGSIPFNPFSDTHPVKFAGKQWPQPVLIQLHQCFRSEWPKFIVDVRYDPETATKLRI